MKEVTIKTEGESLKYVIDMVHGSITAVLLYYKAEGRGEKLFEISKDVIMFIDKRVKAAGFEEMDILNVTRVSAMMVFYTHMKSYMDLLEKDAKQRGIDLSTLISQMKDENMDFFKKEYGLGEENKKNK